jgi:hypothetical protein
MTERETKMRANLHEIERDIVATKVLRRRKRADGVVVDIEDNEIKNLKIAAGRIRAHLERRVYG